MPGRYTLTRLPAEEDRFRPVISQLKTSSNLKDKLYNIAPTQENIVIRQLDREAGPEARLMRWGLIPSWAKTDSSQKLLINARAETVADKPLFKAAFHRRRCIVPADGFYEWKRKRDVNQPYYFQMADESVFYMAGVWESWRNEKDEAIESYLILTTRPNSLVSKAHDRMPVILQGDKLDFWLIGKPELFEAEQQADLFEPLPAKAMTGRPVSQAVNNASLDGPECLEAPKEEATTQLDMGF